MKIKENKKDMSVIYLWTGNKKECKELLEAVSEDYKVKIINTNVESKVLCKEFAHTTHYNQKVLFLESPEGYSDNVIVLEGQRIEVSCGTAWLL